jgi:hypothetical protein
MLEDHTEFLILIKFRAGQLIETRGSGPVPNEQIQRLLTFFRTPGGLRGQNDLTGLRGVRIMLACFQPRNL